MAYGTGLAIRPAFSRRERSVQLTFHAPACAAAEDFRRGGKSWAGGKAEKPTARGVGLNRRDTQS
eukprot:scaffold15125_cov111-Isochrysis_galbana.AAC.2